MISRGGAFAFALLVLAGGVHAESKTPRLQLQAMVEQVQQAPDDPALRERVIKFAVKMHPAPAIPEDARRAFVKGNTAMSTAKTAEDYGRAVELYRQALWTAPWWGDAYLNLGKARELRQEFDLAITALQFYLLTGVKAAEARQAQDQIYVLEEKRDSKKGADVAAKPAGADWSGCWQGPEFAGHDFCNFTLERNGDGWIVRNPSKQPISVVKVQGREIWAEEPGVYWTTHYMLVLSQDGQTIDVDDAISQSPEEFSQMERAQPGGRLTEIGVHKRYTLRKK